MDEAPSGARVMIGAAGLARRCIAWLLASSVSVLAAAILLSFLAGSAEAFPVILGFSASVAGVGCVGFLPFLLPGEAWERRHRRFFIGAAGIVWPMAGYLYYLLSVAVRGAPRNLQHPDPLVGIGSITIMFAEALLGSCAAAIYICLQSVAER